MDARWQDKLTGSSVYYFSLLSVENQILFYTNVVNELSVSSSRHHFPRHD